jgi:hypothetical protein
VRITCYAVSVVVLWCLGCGSSSTTTNPNVVVVLLSPTSGTLKTSQTQQFTATVNGTKNTSVTWNATTGSISSSGLYTAPSSIQTSSLQVTITATSQADTRDSAAAILTIVQNPSSPSVNVSPSAAIVSVLGTQQFSASTSNLASGAVTWQVNGTNGGSRSTGYITSNGLYYAPVGLPSTTTASGVQTGIVTVQAISAVDASVEGSAVVTVHASNQDAQQIPIELGTTGGNSKDISIDAGNTFCCGGTLGSLVQREGTLYILGTNHTLARSNAAVLGEPVIQPSLVHTNCDPTQAATVANLSAFYDLKTGSQPRVDAAIAQVISGKVDITGNILYLGDALDSSGVPVPGAPASGTGLPATSDLIGRGVAKSGGATGLTCSTIDSVGVTANVEYTPNCDGTGTPSNVTYSGQVEMAGSGFGVAGDSGSIVVTRDTAEPVALLFAVSDSSTLGNPISDVLGQLKDANGGSPVFVGGSPHTVAACSLFASPPATPAASAKSTSTADLQAAALVRDAHAADLLRIDGVRAVGIGASYDQEASPAILIFATSGISHRGIPAVLERVRTRIVEGNFNATDTVLSASESSRLEQSVSASRPAAAFRAGEFELAKKTQSAHVDDLMRISGVQGVGIGRSFDSTGEAALIVFLIRGSTKASITPVIDNVRLRIVETTRFHAGSAKRAASPPCSLPHSKSR